MYYFYIVYVAYMYIVFMKKKKNMSSLQVGENKDNVRRDVRNLFKLIYKVFPVSKMFTFISDGIKSKNSKQRTGNWILLD